MAMKQSMDRIPSVVFMNINRNTVAQSLFTDDQEAILEILSSAGQVCLNTASEIGFSNTSSGVLRREFRGKSWDIVEEIAKCVAHIFDVSQITLSVQHMRDW